MTAWKPMETAPKDGTVILLVVGDKPRLAHYEVVERIVNGVSSIERDG